MQSMSKQCSNFLSGSGYTVRAILVSLVLLLLMLIVSCGPATNVKHRVHYSLLNQNIQPPRKVVLLQVNIPVIQIRKGPIVDQLEKRSQAISLLVSRKLNSYVKSQRKFKILKLPVFSKAQNAVIRHHMVLYDLVSRNAVNYTTGKRLAGWRSKLTRFDYTIGSGLKFIAKKTGAQAALIVTGEERLVDPSIKRFSSKTYIILGLVDLNSGALLWINYVLDTRRPLNHYGEISYLIDDMLSHYPGLLSYRRAIKK